MAEDEPQTVEYLYPDPEGGPYRLRLWFKVLAGAPVVVGVEFWGVTPKLLPWREMVVTAAAPDAVGIFVGQGEPIELSLPETAIGARAIRLPLKTLLDDWCKWNLAMGGALLQQPGVDEKAVLDRLAVFRPNWPGRRALPPGLLQTVLDRYQIAVRLGDPHPYETVALYLEDQGHDNVTGAKVRGWRKKALDRGLKAKALAEPEPVAVPPVKAVLLPERYGSCPGCDAPLKSGAERLCPVCSKKLAQTAWWVKEKP